MSCLISNTQGYVGRQYQSAQNPNNSTHPSLQLK